MRLIAAVQRFPGRAEPDAEARLAIEAGDWQDLLTGRRFTAPEGGLPAAPLFADLPAAVLVRL
jgi:hypothetical protein